ncbi:MAG: M23 family peptidase, partial [Myxococcales bacterium]
MSPSTRTLSAPLFAAITLAVALSGAVLPAYAATWPLDPVPGVVHDFDPPESRWGAGHRGVDLGGHPGQAVLAAAAGRVTHA